MSVTYRRSAVVLLVLIVGITGICLWRSRSPSPATVASLKAEVPGLILADMNLLDLPATPTGQQQLLDADQQAALRQAVLGAWDPGAAEDRERDVTANRELLIRDPTGIYDEVRASVVSWDAIGGSAQNAHVRVTVSASVHRATTGAWDGARRTQWQFGVRKQPNGTWKLTSERVTAYLSGQG